ncbi:CD3324 family protein [Alkaliphilus serpentinus]|uniref:Mor transcription activator family protein n=1 Tax=Alkaliphilus serpentinus TaxID=1482731 RepID=A0A833MAJ4_9FIRM|nr:CD3324 family protein [Alkaliphilus serpentinus]KAB3531104.1 hypothetical protein F8153_05570 [Alkaliphilus serpentinus]
MRYKNGRDLFPPELLKEIQKYVQGEKVYIPQTDENRAGWGEKSGGRIEISFRNGEIVKKYNEGFSIEDLGDLFCLSTETIRKIIYKNKKSED